MYSSNHIDLHYIGSLYTLGISCKYFCYDDWTCDEALSQVYGEKEMDQVFY